MQGPWRRGRIAAAAAGLAFLGVLILAGVFRNEIEAWYHLERLKREPGYFARIAGEPEGGPERAACERYIAREEGKLALLREVASRLSGFTTKGWTNYSLSLDASRPSVFVLVGLNNPLEVHDIHEIFGRRPWDILGWLPALGCGEYVLPEDPTTVYRINFFEGRIGVHVRKDVLDALTPPPGPPASTPPSPPSTGTSAG